jgi:hypothetical protein
MALMLTEIGIVSAELHRKQDPGTYGLMKLHNAASHDSEGKYSQTRTSRAVPQSAGSCIKHSICLKPNIQCAPNQCPPDLELSSLISSRYIQHTDGCDFLVTSVAVQFRSHYSNRTLAFAKALRGPTTPPVERHL